MTRQIFDISNGGGESFDDTSNSVLSYNVIDGNETTRCNVAIYYDWIRI